MARSRSELTSSPSLRGALAANISWMTFGSPVTSRASMGFSNQSNSWNTGMSEPKASEAGGSWTRYRQGKPRRSR